MNGEILLQASREIERLTAQRDRLLAALAVIAEGESNADHARHCHEHRRLARAAIAEVEGET